MYWPEIIVMIEKTFEKLCSEAKNDRIKTTLTAIHEVCQEQYDCGSKDFSIATISRLGKDRGVPRAQSIRNKTGKIYQALIKLWQNNNPPSKKTKTSSSFDWVERIEDPTIKYLVYDLVSENKNLISELQICKSVKKLNIDMRKGSSSEEFRVPKLISSEREALIYAVDESFLDAKGWRQTSRGAIVDADGKTIFKNGFVSALKKLASFSN